MRLTELGYNVGLVSSERYKKFSKMKEELSKEIARLENTFVQPTAEVNGFLEGLGSSPIKGSTSLKELLKRPEVTYKLLTEIDKNRNTNLSPYVQRQAEIQLKYEGYINKQLQQIEKFKKLEDRKLNEGMDYEKVDGLRIEAMQKLNQFKPLSVGQAARISGVSPADINVLLVYLEKQRRMKKEN